VEPRGGGAGNRPRHCIGCHALVVAYRRIARDTVKEKILELQAQKRDLAESILSEDNSVLRKVGGGFGVAVS